MVLYLHFFFKFTISAYLNKGKPQSEKTRWENDTDKKKQFSKTAQDRCQKTNKLEHVEALTLLGLGLIKINDVSANFNNLRPSLISNNRIYKTLTYVMYIYNI